MTRTSVEDAIEIALVNNMPDQALATTQTQFAKLVRAAAGERKVSLSCYTLPGHARSDTARHYLERSHEDIETLYRRGADALIVTGAEPRAARLQDEPFWTEFQRLVDWARTNTTSTIWSCLAAHAAVLHLDGIERRRLHEKLSGVFVCDAVAQDWRGGASARRLSVPHSRYNDLPRQALESAGYAIASHAPQIGVDSFWKRTPSLFLFLQGHPEYEADTLAKEYRRDVLRFVNGERADYPQPPVGCFSPNMMESLERLRETVLLNRSVDVEEQLGALLSSEKREADWASDTACLYRDWVSCVARERNSWRNSA